jgi:hypothetical protein
LGNGVARWQRLLNDLPRALPLCSSTCTVGLPRVPSCFGSVGHLVVSCQSAPPPMAFGKTIPVPEASDAKVGCCGYFRVSPFDFAFSMRFLIQFLLLCFPLICSGSSSYNLFCLFVTVFHFRRTRTNTQRLEHKKSYCPRDIQIMHARLSIVWRTCTLGNATQVEVLQRQILV